MKNVVFFIIIIVIVAGGVVLFNYNKVENQNDINVKNETDASGAVGDIMGPTIEVEPEEFDFGTVKYGDVAERTFIIKNTGDEPLEILRLSTSCGCTSAVIAEDERIIAPRKEVEMRVAFDPAVHKDDSGLGNVKRIVYIKTNDKNNPEVEINISANVIK